MSAPDAELNRLRQEVAALTALVRSRDRWIRRLLDRIEALQSLVPADPGAPCLPAAVEHNGEPGVDPVTLASTTRTPSARS